MTIITAAISLEYTGWLNAKVRCAQIDDIVSSQC
jgi:hypothetical protein